MTISIRKALSEQVRACYGAEADRVLAYLSDDAVDPASIRAVMINEVVADCPENDFYSPRADAAYLKTALPMLREGGADVWTMADVRARGIHVTSAVRLPKAETTIPREIIARDVPLLAAELALFDNLRAIMLMGDVARKAFNQAAKARTGKVVIPSGATYRLRADAYYCGDVRVFPAYIMTGKNILIEKSKGTMNAEDIRRMLAMWQQA